MTADTPQEFIASSNADRLTSGKDMNANVGNVSMPRAMRINMLSHVMVGSNNIERSKEFYDAVLGTLGAGAPMRHKTVNGQTQLFYLHEGSMFCVSEPIDAEPATVGNGSTFGFKCISFEQVREFHDTAIAHGGSSIEAVPSLRDNGFGPMHLAYVRDPDGNKLCAIHRAA